MSLLGELKRWISYPNPRIQGKVYLTYKYFTPDFLKGGEVAKPHGFYGETSAKIPSEAALLRLFSDRAKEPDDADTLVEVEWHLVPVGHYTGIGQGASRIDCKVRVIEAATHRTVAKRTFAGPPPPQTILDPRSKQHFSAHVASDFKGFELRNYLWRLSGKDTEVFDYEDLNF